MGSDTKHYVLMYNRKYYRSDDVRSCNYFQDDNINNADVFSVESEKYDEWLKYCKDNILREDKLFPIGNDLYCFEVEVKIK